jgi:hypothetical protein
MDAQTLIARRIAQELREGMLVNLGIGIPTLVAKFVPWTPPPPPPPPPPGGGARQCCVELRWLLYTDVSFTRLLQRRLRASSHGAVPPAAKACTQPRSRFYRAARC